MGSARENLVPQDMDIEKKPTDMTGSTRKKIRRPQIEQYPSVRTICPGEGCREHPKKQKRRCGNSSVAAAFLWPDSEKALKSRAFGQNEKAGNFCQNYLPFLSSAHKKDILATSVEGTELSNTTTTLDFDFKCSSLAVCYP